MSEKRLKSVMAIQSSTYETQAMDDFIYEQYEKIIKGNEDNYSYVYDDGNTYITKGIADTYPCVIAHTDTVHDIQDNFVVFEDENLMFAMDMDFGLQVGIGGDDKVGIYVALEMLRECDIIKVAFFRDEEHGCLGSREADMRWFENVEFVLQCDRQGYKDFVAEIFGNILFDKKFSDAISDLLSRYGKKETRNGGMTDVYQLTENGLDVCVANLSCGYYRPHCDDEIIYKQEVFDTRDLVYEIIQELSGRKWINSLYRPAYKYDRYEYAKPKRSKSNKKTATDWKERSKDDWWAGGPQDEPVWTEVADRYGVPVHRPLPVEGDFDPEDAMQHTDLEMVCVWCESDEVMYDPEEDADWCFCCREYTTYYNHKPRHIIEDDFDNRPTDNELIHYQNHREI